MAIPVLQPKPKNRRRSPVKTVDGGLDARAELTPAVRLMLDNFRLDDVCSHLLRRAHFMAEQLFAAEFADTPLTPRQKAALVIVHQRPGLNQNSLADHLFIDRNTVAEMVGRLVTAKLLRRESAKTDQRAYQLFLSSAGAQLLNRVMPRDAAVEARVLERLPEEYRPLFVKCLRLLVDAPGLERGGGRRDAG